MALLKASKRGKLPIVNGAGELLALATRALFKEDARMPLGGARCSRWGGRRAGRETAVRRWGPLPRGGYPSTPLHEERAPARAARR